MTKPSWTHRPVTRADAGTAGAWMVFAAAVTILITRLYLRITGYPQVGGEIFHIAHSIWGGLLLMIALFMTLGLANRWALAVAAVIGGVGTGLFVDEVGKFITQDNDYFFPLAAPIAYTVLAVFGVGAFYLGTRQRRDARSHLYAALELSKAMLDGPLTPSQIKTITRHLDAAGDDEHTPEQKALIYGIREAAQTAAEHDVDDDERAIGRFTVWFRRVEQRCLPMSRTRKVARGGLVVLAVLGVLLGPGVLVYSL